MNSNNAVSVNPTDSIQSFVVCVDDEPRILRSVVRLLEPVEAEIVTFECAEQALEFMEVHNVKVVISDMRMPGMSGAEFLSRVRAMQPEAYRILITGYADLTSTIYAVNEGRIQRYISKPWSNDELLGAVQAGMAAYQETEEKNQHQQITEQQMITLERQVVLRTQQLRKTIMSLNASNARNAEASKGTLSVLLNALSVNPIADPHYLNSVASMCVLLAKKLGLTDTEVKTARLAGLLLNLGLLGVDTRLLRKKRSELTFQEQQEIRRHPQIAKTILSPAEHLNDVAHVVACQNEWFNGTGEPSELSGTEIPIETRVLVVARDLCKFVRATDSGIAEGIKNARRRLVQYMGTQYDPSVVEVVLSMNIEEFESENLSDNTFSVDRLEPGMLLTEDLYNSGGLLLLAGGAILTREAIKKLIDYQSAHDDTLLVKAELTPECGTLLEG
ncbi:response regulator [Salinispirillum sp. LH 10-3-1]|uniref:Response regulator n=1 Tax=Salinispirillum sp. LH 10-3-1 TaxID=2952525 RepID=A0AB38YI16_9GAMM